jgi:hypothetical protein
MTRNYGKKTRRYRMGGIVPYEGVPRPDAADEMPDIPLDRGKGERELEKNRGEVLDRKPDEDYEELPGDENPSKEDVRDA